MSEAALIARSEADHAQMLRQLLPRGAAWDFAPDGTFARLIAALAAEFARIDIRAIELLDEADPRTALETLIDWERVAGLPDACTGQPDNVRERQIALVQKLTSIAGQAPADFIDLAALIGFEIDIEEHRPLRTGFRVGDRCMDEAWAFAWTVIVQPFDGAGRPVLAIAHFKVGDPVGTRVRGFGSLDLECVIRRAAPAHTTVIFAYVIEREPDFWIDFTS
ncbi:YmfQ family protein [Erythrobacter colymbi]|uniref:YmfQ family protein n=1 Tax=Erythrobacter colymbi TaxID=1161202 RepID=UPI000A36FF1E|nr:putative phage tail protein [Erythrobacter colymbi]